MATYTVHEPPPKRYESSSDPERFAFVRDGFSFWAFVLAPLWMLRHRMWLVFVGYVVVIAALEIALHVVGASGTVKIVVGLFVSLLVGFEAGTLRRFTLGRRRWNHVGVVVGDDRETAERRFFDSWVRGAPTAPSPPPAVLSQRFAPASPDVIGLFPESGTPR